MNSKMRLDRVTIFGNKLSFLIPHECHESDEEGDYLYHQPNADSGWLRVSLLTVKAESDSPSGRLKTLSEGRSNVTQERRTGNLVHSYEKDAEENGVPIHLYYWMVANIVPPDLVREAVFSYAILRSRLDDQSTRGTVELLAKLVSAAEFC